MKIEYNDGQLWKGDCLELMKDISDGSVDMILCDLPYGTTECKWDTIIPFEPLWEQYWRVCKPSAAIILTASQPFTTMLIASQINNFKYEWIWEKSKASNFLRAKYQPLKSHENICVFSRGVCAPGGKLLTKYFPQMVEGDAYDKGINEGRNNTIRPNALRAYENKSSGKRYPRSVQYFRTAESEGKHPTQKPVALFEYLIKTYTNPGEIVLDNCSGSGTTAIAARNTGRRWICIEKDEIYFEKSRERIEAHVVLDI